MDLVKLPACKTKIVCTIGPASFKPEIMRDMLEAGMNVARLNFSHGEFETHAQVIRDLRLTAEEQGKELAIMADLPGPKIRIGRIPDQPIDLEIGQSLTLTTEGVAGTTERISVSFDRLPQAVRTGDLLYINDGLIQLAVERVVGRDVHCDVVVGGKLHSRKGLNLPGIDLGIQVFTDRDRECLAFALEQGVDAVSQSFVETPADIEMVRDAARELGYPDIFILAKIERLGALNQIEPILDVADGIMIARGDLGVEIPIARIATVQKRLMRLANRSGKPVITATQMLESMITNRRPTRAETTDVANAILDGTDCVMLSAESAMGCYPVEAVRTLVAIAVATEPENQRREARDIMLQTMTQEEEIFPAALVGFSVGAVFEQTTPAAVIVDTQSGWSARNVTRLRLPTWVLARSPHRSTCRALQFSYGVYAVHAVSGVVNNHDPRAATRLLFDTLGMEGDLAVLVEGPSPQNPDAIHRIGLLDV